MCETGDSETDKSKFTTVGPQDKAGVASNLIASNGISKVPQSRQMLCNAVRCSDLNPPRQIEVIWLTDQPLRGSHTCASSMYLM